ncbi:uncharacterized protein LOC118442322 isoform X2 [Vespa mandarinia]|uniref:uncharacterized protein LOC118442322 isoform X2 n=1 Tax=Vespa mandarinia TaxID=7446 RepID=UPI001613C0CD|nr:uncharacterized protein LOC118442322 isoform X2 [Vespa mandarinia]
MWLPILLLFLLTCQISTSIALYNEENIGFRGDLTRVKFGERVRDWFRTLKDRLLGRKSEYNDSENGDMINLYKAEIQDRVRNSGGFFVDLSKVTFDPKYDIGFRIGRWYFIRMGDTIDNEFIYNDSREWDMPSSFMPDQSTHQLSDNDWSNDNYNNIFKTMLSPPTTETTFSTEQTITESDAIESYTTEASVILLENNETESIGNSASVEVIFP